MPSVHKAQNTESKVITKVSENVNARRQFSFIPAKWPSMHTHTQTIELNVKQ